MTTTCMILGGMLFCYTIPPVYTPPQPAYQPVQPYYQPYAIQPLTCSWCAPDPEPDQ